MMCATTLMPKPPLKSDATLEAALAVGHDEWMADGERFVLPLTNADATFLDRWSGVRYLTDRFLGRVRLERALLEELRPWIGSAAMARLTLHADRMLWLHNDCTRLAGDRGTARELARRSRDLLEAARLWCAEVELVTGSIRAADASETVKQLLGQIHCPVGSAGEMALNR